jgi:sulfate/thiosulfate transport system substrate-binding protein
MRRHNLRRNSVLGALALPLAVALVGTTDASASVPTPRTSYTVNVVGYSVVAGVYAKLEASFQKTLAGKNVSFNNSFGASTTQADDVVAGQPADVVNFSAVPDMQLLVDNGIVGQKWNSTGAGATEGGFVSDSVVVFLVRPGNPLGITGWPSLVKSGVQIVTPDPISSGSARWNLLETYESQIKLKKTASAAAAYTNSVVKNVVAEPSSGSKALTAFLAGTGNVLLAYESDAKAAVAAAKPVKIVYPAQNIVIQTPAALTTTANKGAKAFFAYLFSSAGQSIWAHNGFRPTLKSTATATKSLFHAYAATQLTTIASLGGWPAVTAKFFSTNGIITKIERAHGWTS